MVNCGRWSIRCAAQTSASSASVARATTKKKCMNKSKKKITAREFDEKFDAGEDVSDYIDFSRATRPGHAKSRVNVDMPDWMIHKLDLVADRHGLARQALIKAWLADRLKLEAA